MSRKKGVAWQEATQRPGRLGGMGMFKSAGRGACLKLAKSVAAPRPLPLPLLSRSDEKKEPEKVPSRPEIVRLSQSGGSAGKNSTEKGQT